MRNQKDEFCQNVGKAKFDYSLVCQQLKEAEANYYKALSEYNAARYDTEVAKNSHLQAQCNKVEMERDYYMAQQRRSELCWSRRQYIECRDYFAIMAEQIEKEVTEALPIDLEQAEILVSADVVGVLLDDVLQEAANQDDSSQDGKEKAKGKGKKE